MLVKKLTLLGVASVATLGMTFASAGGSVDVEKSGFYVGANAGMFYRNQQDNGLYEAHGGAVAARPLTFDNGKHGFTYGAFLGYQLNNYYSLELGWNSIAKQKATDTADNSYFEIKDSQLFYIAAKGSLPLMDSLGAFAKVGAGYSYNKINYVDPSNATVDASGKVKKWNVVFAAGLEYALTDSFDIGAQMMLMPAVTSNRWVGSQPTNTAIDIANLYTYTAFVSYRF